MVNDFISKCVSIRKDQEEFIRNESRGFKMSKFVQAKLDGYIKMMNEYREFMEKEVE